VVSVAGTPVASVAELLDAVAALPPGQPAELGAMRGSKTLKLTVDVVQRQRPQPQALRRQR